MRAGAKLENGLRDPLGNATQLELGLSAMKDFVMPKRKEPELDPKEQFKRFQETAEQHGVDTSVKEIEDGFKALARPRRARKTSKRDGS